jgi:class 3 adenylate cyclase/TolB-like protein/tetratricopeptide (TPR) repeat protein
MQATLPLVVDGARRVFKAPARGCPERVKRVIPENLASVVEVPRVVRTVLVADVVESVRLMQEDETGTVQRWRAFVDHVVHRLLPGQDGRLVKSLGDGLMLEFTRVATSVNVAFAMQDAAAQINRDLPAERRMHLRIGIHVSSLIADDLDVYGHGVNLAARITTLAGPDEIVVSADVRDQLTPALDADIEDLGECYVKHVQQPVRAFRVGAPGEQPVIERGNLAEDLRATIAVIPFRPRALKPSEDVLGQLLADEVISVLSRSPEVNVVSRLSTTVFQSREIKLDDVSAFLRADYVVSGSYHVDGDRVTLKAELAETRSMKVVWTQTLKGSVQGIVTGDDPLPAHLVNEACAAMMVSELQRSQGKAPQSLQNHTLLLSSITLMHRISPLAFQRAQQMLQVLIERTPRLASPYAWLAKWHVLRVTQGWSADAQADGRAALDNTKRALDRDATSSLAMTVEGQVNTYILKRLDVAEQYYAQALQSNPNDALAWLLKGTLHAFRDEGREAVRHTRQALKLSPLDPLKYYFDSLAATAALSAGQFQRALQLAERSLRLNRTHTSTLRAMITALWHLERQDEARVVAADLLRMDPGFRVSTYLEKSPTGQYALGRSVASALVGAGIPS